MPVTRVKMAALALTESINTVALVRLDTKAPTVKQVGYSVMNMSYAVYKLLYI